MKVSIIGGGGRVGSDAAFALQLGGIVREIALMDMNQETAAGEANSFSLFATLELPNDNPAARVSAAPNEIEANSAHNRLPPRRLFMFFPKVNTKGPRAELKTPTRRDPLWLES